jgi:predicted P-loop ATPase
MSGIARSKQKHLTVQALRTPGTIGRGIALALRIAKVAQNAKSQPILSIRSMTTNFFTSLINSGILPQDATVLEQVFNQEVDFIEGMELIATWLALKQTPNQAAPIGQPWKNIFTHMFQEVSSGVDIDTAYSNSLHAYSGDVQVSLTKALSVQIKKILDFEQQKGNKKRFKTKDYLTQLKRFGYDFKLNECDDTIEINGEPLEEGHIDTIRSQLRDAGFYQVTTGEEAYRAYAWKHRYHPVKDYLSSLSWDGQPYIQNLCDYFTDEFGMFSIWLRKWLIGACAKVFEAQQNPMLILDGKQGIGKSEFVRWLAKPLPAYFTEGSIDPNNKDCIIRLARYWIWEVSELGATTRKADYEALKSFLTTRKITVRKPYGRVDIIKPAMASFIGTINNSTGIFSDPTGNRRFLVSNILSIDWGYAGLDPGLLWAEAMAAYLAKEDYRIAPDEQIKANEIAEYYGVIDPIENLLMKYFIIDPADQTKWTATTDILSVLENPTEGNLKGNSRGNAMALAAVATKLGLQRRKRTNSLGQRAWGYAGIKIAPIVVP